MEFAYDGVHPIVIKVYNTIARNSLGLLYDTPGSATIIYADAFMAAPTVGSITASPTVTSWGPGAGQTRVTNVVNEVGRIISNGQPVDTSQGVVYSYDYAWENPYAATTPSDLSCAQDRGSRSSSLWIFNHFLTAPLVKALEAELGVSAAAAVPMAIRRRTSASSACASA